MSGLEGESSTHVGDDSTDAGRAPDGAEPSEARLYRWTCPYCEEFGIQSATPEDVERYVVNSLRSHVRSTDGDGHGPRRTFPDEDVESAIGEYVELLETDR